VLLIVGVIYLLSVVSAIVQTLILAGLFAFILFFPARALTRRLKVSWVLSVVLCYGILITVLVVGIGGLVPALSRGVASASEGINRLYGELQITLRDWDNSQGIVDVFGQQVDINPVIASVREAILPPPETTPEPLKDGEFAEETPATGLSATDRAGNLLADLGIDLRSIFSQAGSVLSAATIALGTVTGFFSGLLFALFISFLIMLDLPRAMKTLGDWIPSAYHREAALLLERLEHIWTGFLRGQVIIGILIGVITFIQLTVMGAGNVLLLSVVVALISLIPTIGGLIALVPLFVGPLLTGSTTFVDMNPFTFALLVVIVNLILSQIIWNVIAPKILGDALNLPVVVIIVGVFVGAAVGGVLGAFLVAPIMSTLWLFFVYLTRKISQKDPFPGEEPQLVLGTAHFAEAHPDEPEPLIAAADELPPAPPPPAPADVGPVALQ
jgi:predicted PurR-regulated permease PerM